MSSGILLVNKPRGVSSNQALCKIKKRLKIRKAGHTGSLDPLASGMLPICLGEATKFARFFLEADKSYTVSAQFGATSSTGDAEGTISVQTDCDLSVQDIQSCLGALTGTISQIPPMYSAVKVGGKTLYKLARKGIEIDRPARQIQIHEFLLQSFDENAQVASFSVVCSKGTYIRTLIEDLGKALGVGAYVTVLHRNWVAPFQTHVMVDVYADTIGNDKVMSISKALDHLPTVSLCEQSAFHLGRGMWISGIEPKADGAVVLNNHQGDFIGIGEFKQDGRLAPTRLMQIARTIP